MTNISDLERKMLKCDHKCAEHKMTQEIIHHLEKCVGTIKNRMNKIVAKTHWLIGVMVLAGFLTGYGFNSIHDLEKYVRKQEGINQTIQASNLRLPTIIETQHHTAVSIAKIQQDILYMKKDMKEIKKLLKDKG